MPTLLLPPPNVTGVLHLGHAYEHTLSDVVMRMYALRGKSSLWVPGLDHAGIATQNVVERALNAQGVRREELGREKFLEEVWAHKERSGSTIINQMQTLNTSCDWERLRFTMDEEHQKTVQEAFVSLYKDGFIFRAERASAYCPRCATSLSDIEVEDGLCSRCHTLTETRTTFQWYLDLPRFESILRKVVADGELTLDPPEMKDEWDRWCSNLQPWCISRQLWWGHRIPVAESEGVFQAFGPGESFTGTQEEDVLDTWFSSALWPLILKDAFPSDFLITGRDLLFFWVMRMVALSYHQTGTLPFKTVHFHGMIRDEFGRKMSKSAGNAVDPLPLIEEFGEDTLRLALMRASRTSQDIPFGNGDLVFAKAFLTKLKNVIAFAENWGASAEGDFFLNDFLASRLSSTRKSVLDSIDTYSVQNGVMALSTYLENDISDLFIEATKSLKLASSKKALLDALQGFLSLLYPFAPRTAEEGLQALKRPLKLPEGVVNAQAEEDGEIWREAWRVIRSERVKRELKRDDVLPGACRGFTGSTFLERITNLSTIPGNTLYKAGSGSVLLAAHVLTSAQRSKLEKEHAQQHTVHDRAASRLLSVAFREKAKPEAVADAKRQVAASLSRIKEIEDLLR